MTQDKAPDPNEDAIKPSSDAANKPASTEDPQAAAEAAAPPEPLTPERMEAENRRSDWFIMAGVTIVAFLLGFFRITESDLWLHLKSGWFIEQDGVPTKDPFSYASAGRGWVNSSWLYDYGLYQAELLETRWRARRLTIEYQALLRIRLIPKFDEQNHEIDKLPETDKADLEQALARLRASTDTADTGAMRLAAEQLVDTAKRIGVELPAPAPGVDPGDYPEIVRYSGPGGGAFVNLAGLVLLKSLLLAGMAAVVWLVRHPGPTRWWTAVALGIALVAMSSGLTLRPQTVSLLLLAAVFLILHQFEFERTWAIWFLPAVVIVWVNLDWLFFLAILLPLITLICQTIAQLFRSLAQSGTNRWTKSKLMTLTAATGLSAAATLANPFGISAWSIPRTEIQQLVVGTDIQLRPPSDSESDNSDADNRARVEAKRHNDVMLSLQPDLISPLSRVFWESTRFGRGLPSATAGVLIALAVLSFVINGRHLNVARGITLLVFVALLLGEFRFLPLTALVAGVTLALNGQECFLRRFGSETRISRGWVIWSLWGRLATLLGITAVAIAGIMGWLGGAGANEFGWGVDWLRFDLDTAKFLRQARRDGLIGQGLNTTPAQGNLLLWSNFRIGDPATQVFVDDRLTFHGTEFDELENLKVGLRRWGDKKADQVSSTLDKLNVSHVILNLSGTAGTTFFNTHHRLAENSQQWSLLHLDAASAVFGRTGLPAEHPLAAAGEWSLAHAFDPVRLVFHENGERLPDPPPPATAPTFIDRYWRKPRMIAGQSNLGDHFLDPRVVKNIAPEGRFVPAPEYCYLAIRASRRTLAKQPSSAEAYSVLSDAYLYLLNIESQQAQGPDVHEIREFEYLTALRQLVTSKPDYALGRLQLAQRYLSHQYVDLASEEFEAVLKLLPEDAEVPLFGSLKPKSEVIVLAEKLRDTIDKVKLDLEQYVGNAQPVARANVLASRGCPGMAIQQLTDSAPSLPDADSVVFLANLYIRTGQPGDAEQGAENVMKNLDDQLAGRSMGSPPGLRPGIWEEMWGVVRLMQGDYRRAKIFFERAIALKRHGLARDLLLSTAHETVRGGLQPMLTTIVDLADDAERQARLEYHLGLLQLEAGEPMEATRHFKQALAVREDLPSRPIIGFYLEKITGEQLEPLPEPPKQEKVESEGSKAESQKEKKPEGDGTKPVREREKSKSEPQEPETGSKKPKEQNPPEQPSKPQQKPAENEPK